MATQPSGCSTSRSSIVPVDVYTTQLMPVSEIALREGLRAFGANTPQQVVIWEQLMDARTVLLTANTETVYALAHLNLKADGPTVVEAPPHMLGFIQDGLQRYIADVGPLGADKGNGGKFLVLPPDFTGKCPRRAISSQTLQPIRSRSACVAFSRRAAPTRRSG